MFGTLKLTTPVASVLVLVLVLFSQVRFEGLLGGGAAGDLANDLINQLIPSLWEDVKGDIVTAAAEAIKNLANGLLEGVTLEDILDLINGAKLVKL